MRLPPHGLVPLSTATSWQRLGYFFVGARDLLREHATPHSKAAARAAETRTRKRQWFVEAPISFLLAGVALVLLAQGLSQAARAQWFPGTWLSSGLLWGGYFLVMVLALGGAWWGYGRGRAAARGYDALVLRGYEIRIGVRVPYAGLAGASSR